MRRVEDLIPAPCQLPQQAEEVPLGVRAEVELGLLDQQHEAAEVGGEETLHPHHELEPAVGCRPVMRGDGRLEEPGHVCRRPRRGRDERTRAQVRREEQHRRRAGPVEVQRVGRARVEEDRAATLDLRLEVDAPTQGDPRHVVDRRRRRRSFEQRPDRRQHRRLPARRLTDERADRTRLEVELVRCAIATDRDSLERGHRLSVHGAQSEPR